MHPVSVPSPPRPRAAGFLLALESFADEVCGTLARLVAYLGTLALLGILALAFWQQLAAPASVEPAGRSGQAGTAAANSADWVTSTGDLPLRGTL